MSKSICFICDDVDVKTDMMMIMMDFLFLIFYYLDYSFPDDYLNLKLLDAADDDEDGDLKTTRGRSICINMCVCTRVGIRVDY